jgi:hypothetical protein
VSTIQESPVHKLHPTQLTVGMIEVKDKARHLAKLTKDEAREFMRAHPIPAVLGPEGKLYITDHHHLGRAACESGVESGFFQIDADLSKLTMDAFWDQMNRHSWVHPLDENGVRHRYALIPRHLEDLVDDIYRSLAGYVRDAGGYEKSMAAFAEFVWADFFRRHIAVEDIKADFKSAVDVALPLAHGDHAKGLPGYLAK